MCAHVLLTILNDLGKEIMRGLLDSLQDDTYIAPILLYFLFKSPQHA